jgi:flagellin-like protein
MKLKELLTDDDAVSPVIGVILMVAITVILAAVIATFVLGLGEQVSDTAPNANFEFDYNSSGNGEVTVTHTSGPAIDVNKLSFGGPGFDGTTANFGNYSSVGEQVSAGDSATVIDGDVTAGERMSVIWKSDEGESATLANYDIPS